MAFPKIEISRTAKAKAAVGLYFVLTVGVVQLFKFKQSINKQIALEQPIDIVPVYNIKGELSGYTHPRLVELNDRELKPHERAL